MHLPIDVELAGIRFDSNWPRVCLYNTPLAPLATCPNLSVLSVEFSLLHCIHIISIR